MQPPIAARFAALDWSADRASLNDLVFRLERGASDRCDDSRSVVLHKSKDLVDQYRMLFEALPSFRPRTLLELGIWKGGSVVLWHELIRPQVHVAIDLERREESEPLKRYLRESGASARFRLIWGFDQQDRPRLRELVRTDFPDGPDLVVDDASHLLRPTLASFETLFPLMRPGAIYIVEDWAWAHWKESMSPSHPWANEPPLTDFVRTVIEAVGTATGLISRIIVHPGFVAIERGHLTIGEPAGFRLSDHIQSRDSGRSSGFEAFWQRMLVACRSLLRRLRHFWLRIR